MNLGQRLIALRTEKGLFQKEVAVYLKVTIGTISNYEKGVHSPDPETLCKLADFYGVTTDYLLGRTDFNHDYDQLKKNFVTDYTIAQFLNTVISFSQGDREKLADYADLLKMRQKNTRTSKKS